MVWTSEKKRIIGTLIAAMLLLVAASIASNAAELKPETVNAWDQYIHSQDARVGGRSEAKSFLWSDESADRVRRLREGEVLVAPVGENPKVVPHGLIHHWIGAMFLPNTRLEDVLKTVRDYDEYKDFYAPNVIDSSLLREGIADDEFSLRLMNKAALAKVALDVRFHSSYTQVDQSRWYSVGSSTTVREVENYGQANEEELAPDTGHGFIWRLYNISRFQQRDCGVYVELEAVALSRDVPGALRWIVNPVVRRTSKGSMLVSLQKTEEAVLGVNEQTSRLRVKPQEVAFTKATGR